MIIATLTATSVADSSKSAMEVIVITSGANNSELNGNYAFLFQGFLAGDVLADGIAGSFVADGNGLLTSGVEDNTILGHIKISQGCLIAEVNSENRAKWLRKEIAKRLGSIGVHQRTVAQTLEEMRKNASQREAAEAESQDAEVDALLLDPEARKQLQATMQRQIEDWVHQKIPALGGRTPIEAVRDPDGKEIVEALLLQWERHDENSVHPNQIRPDISALRRLLNLAPSAT